MDDAVHPDLWTKVAALDQCCRVFITRHGDPGQPRVWRVRVVKDDDALAVDDASLVRVLTAAVLAADARGWNPAHVS